MRDRLVKARVAHHIVGGQNILNSIHTERIPGTAVDRVNRLCLPMFRTSVFVAHDVHILHVCADCTFFNLSLAVQYTW